MSLENIEYGSLASSEVVNNNFEYLDERITDTANKIYSNNANLESKIANLNSSLTNTKNDLDSKITEANKNLTSGLGKNGLYITQYRNGTSWCREYFSDAEKTNRVWLEQGFLTPTIGWGDNNCKTYNLVKAFKENNYTVVVSSTLSYVGNGVSSGNVNVEWTSTTQIGIGNDAGNTFGVRVYACGY